MPPGLSGPNRTQRFDLSPSSFGTRIIIGSSGVRSSSTHSMSGKLVPREVVSNAIKRLRMSRTAARLLMPEEASLFASLGHRHAGPGGLIPGAEGSDAGIPRWNRDRQSGG